MPSQYPARTLLTLLSRSLTARSDKSGSSELAERGRRQKTSPPSASLRRGRYALTLTKFGDGTLYVLPV